MPLTSRQKRPLDRAVAFRDARLLVIATEGEKTEKIYFESFNTMKVKVKILPSVDGKSDPDETLARMYDFKKEFQLDSGDELWIVIDRDRWPVKKLNKIARACVNGNMNLALSNPCFEVWLALHYTSDIPPTLKSTESEDFVKALHPGYQKAKYNPLLFLERTNEAVANGRALDVNLSARWQQSVGSRVYKLVLSILSLPQTP